MVAPELDNPFWSSLCTRHRGLALRAGDVARYPPEYAPFLGVAHDRVDADAIASLLEPGESVYLLGVAPELPAGWTLKAYEPLAQMVCAAPLQAVDGPEIIELSDTHRADVLALTALVYPHYFRPRTMDMGRYFGIYMPDESRPDERRPYESRLDESSPDESVRDERRSGGQGGMRLAAMIGERLGTEAWTEMSAICTHPDYNGRGYARRLTAMLTNDTLQRGRTPFLHVSKQNTRALSMYAQMGYRHRRDIGFWSLRGTT